MVPRHAVYGHHRTLCCCCAGCISVLFVARYWRDTKRTGGLIETAFSQIVAFGRHGTREGGGGCKRLVSVSGIPVVVRGLVSGVHPQVSYGKWRIWILGYSGCWCSLLGTFPPAAVSP